MTTLTIVCGWHPRYFHKRLVMGTKDGQGVSGETSSICPDCQVLFDKEWEEYKNR